MSVERSRGEGDRGATLVEFALVAPLLFALIFGMVEFGWAFTQTLDIRHGAREGSRLAAVDYQVDPAITGSAQAAALVAEVCRRMDGQSGATVSLSMPDGSDAGGQVEVTVSKPLDPLTGFFDFATDDITLSSTVGTRLEQQVTWTATTGTCP